MGSIGAQTSTQCSTRTLWFPPTTFLFLWFGKKNHFAVVEGTQTTRFLNKMNHTISHLKGLQTTIPDRSGAQTSTYCTNTYCFPLTTIPGGSSSLD